MTEQLDEFEQMRVWSEQWKAALTSDLFENYSTKKFTDTMANTPNPIRPTSVTTDQDINNPISTGTTYDVIDLKSLEQLKLKLHDLHVQLSTLDSQGNSKTTKLEAQIQDVSKLIDEISTRMGTTGVPGQAGD